MSGIRLKQIDQENIRRIKEKGLENNIVFDNRSQVIRKSLDYTAKYWNPKGD